MTTPKKDRPFQTEDKYVVRFPDGMRDHIAKAAKANNRSMNAEIVSALQNHYQATSFDVGAPIKTKSIDEAMELAMDEYTVRQRALLRALFDKYGIKTINHEDS